MPIEDIDYLKKNSQKQTYMFLVNSKDRDKEAYPTPTEYVVNFSQPFTNVIGINIMDASIPRTMYNIDVYNNKIYYFIHSSNYDLNNLTEDLFQEKEIDPGDYTIQTLVDTLNDTLTMSLNNDLSSNNVNITVETVSNPPDIKNKLQFYCPYPFMFDMKRSTIAESLGFDTFVQSSENNKNNIDKNYIPFSFGSNKQVYHSVDLPFNEATGLTYDMFEGPRGVILNQTLDNYVAQQFTCTNNTTLTRLYSAFTNDNISSNIVNFEIQTDNGSNEPSGIVIGEENSIAISYIDGTLSDSSDLEISLEANQKYWVVFKNNNDSGLYYNDVLNTTNTLKYYDGSSWISLDDSVNDIYYQASIRIEVTDEYHRIEAPGIYSLIGEPYLIIRCREIEENSFRSLAYSKYQLGIGKVKLGVVGYSDERMDFASVPLREFHPIGRLSKFTLSFETGSGLPYDFKGVNHNILFNITYYEPIQKETFKRSIINTNYDGNFMNYMYKQEEQEEESDDQDINYNQDDLEKYRMAESRNLPWLVAQRNVQQYYDLNIDEEEYDEDSNEESSF